MSQTTKTEREDGDLMKGSETLWIKAVQELDFEKERDVIFTGKSNRKAISRNYCQQFGLFGDDDGVLRCKAGE